MRFVVNDSCIGCGMCADTCPDVFEMVDGLAQAADAEISSELEESATGAQEGCPVGAIQSE